MVMSTRTYLSGVYGSMVIQNTRLLTCHCCCKQTKLTLHALQIDRVKSRSGHPSQVVQDRSITHQHCIALFIWDNCCVTSRRTRQPHSSPSSFFLHPIPLGWWKAGDWDLRPRKQVSLCASRQCQERWSPENAGWVEVFISYAMLCYLCHFLH